MSRKKIVAGNWKMNLECSDAEHLVQEVLSAELPGDVLKIFIPSFPFLRSVSQLTKNRKENNFFVGAQNCSEHEKGAYTGEVAACMLRSVGCGYVLVGHSERRTYFHETSEQLVSKIKLALTNNLVPVFCFGEQLAERKSGKHFEVVSKQISEVLKNFSGEQVKDFILAYEPVWAIGTGETASPQQAQEMHAYIRSCVKELFNQATANDLSILYGGSCNAQNAKELFSGADVDGGLIGGASLKAEDFCKIINSF